MYLFFKPYSWLGVCALALVLITLSGCGSGVNVVNSSTSVSSGKDGVSGSTNVDAPKNASLSQVTGSSFDFSQADATAHTFQGIPPLPPVSPPAVQVAALPDTVIPVTDAEIENGAPFSLQAFGFVAEAVSQTYPNLDKHTDLAKRVMLDSLNLTFASNKSAKARTSRGIIADFQRFFDLTPAERKVVLSYLGEAKACSSTSDDAEAMTSKVFGIPSIVPDSIKANAFKHAWWNILMCSRGSFEFAQAFAEAHEAGPEAQEHGEFSKEHLMDRHNNQVGQAVYYVNRPDSGNEERLLAALLRYIEQHPYQWFDGSREPDTASPIYLLPVPEPPAPQDIVVSEYPPVSDASQVGFFKGGTARYWWESRDFGQEGHMYWTYSNGQTRDNYGLWRPQIPQTRSYEVYAYIPSWYASTKNGIYEIHHADGVASVAVRQYDYSDYWKSLGIYRFNQGTDGYVLLGDNTGEPVKARWVGFDSVKWVAR